MAIVTSSGTSSPLLIYSAASLPNSVWFFRFSRNISPEEICGRLSLPEMASACVPFPAPGGPSKTMNLGMEIISPYEQRVIVTMQLEIGIDAEESITDDTHNNQQPRRGGQ